MKIFRIIASILLFQIALNVDGQSVKYGQINLRSPLDIPLYLSGTFGELRNNHFHSGIDIKTEGREGLPVYVAEDGYVSRIKVSPNGYGKVIYITHPNGFVTVYGHLQKFNDRIQEYVKGVQYKNESFSIESYPKKEELIVKKGEVIAWSGDTGGSSGPHLHFEIREQGSQHPVNPLFFDGIRIKDEFRPRILELAIYPVDQNSLINGSHDTVFYMVSGSGLNHFLDKKVKIEVSGRVSFGLRSYDPMNDISNKNGIYIIEMQIDTVDVFKLEMDKLSFATTRYINSLIDYHYYKKFNRRMIRTQVDTNNRLFNYRDVASNGIYTFNDGRKHQINYLVKDVNGNSSAFKFNLHAVTVKEVKTVLKKEAVLENGIHFDFRKKNEYTAGNILLSFQPNSFYQSFYFQLDSALMNDGTYSPLYKIHNRFTPVQKNYTLAIKPYGYSSKIKSKLYIAIINDEGEWYIGGDWEGDKIKTETRLFGNYTVKADTVAPEINPVNIYDQIRMIVQNTIQVEINDKETGIASFSGTLNGNWILMEYNPKSGTLTYEIDKYLVAGKNQFKLVVKDMVENITIYEAEIIR